MGKKRKPDFKQRIRFFFMFSEVFYCFFLIFLEALRHKNPYWLPSVILSTFRFYLYIPILFFLILLVWKRSLKRHGLALINACFFLFFYGPLFWPTPPVNLEKAISVMTFNIQQGVLGTDAIIQHINNENPQVLALQEITGDSPVIDFLKQEGYSVSHRPYFENTRAGMAVAVRKPLNLHKVLRKTYHEHGKWSFLFAEIVQLDSKGVENNRFNMVLPHLLPFGLSGNILENVKGKLEKIRLRTYWQIFESEALLELVHQFRDPTIMLGDFNSTPEQNLHSEIRKSMRDAWIEKGFGYGGTRTYGLPLRIDYIYASPHFKIAAVHRGPSGLSDHRSVIATLIFGEAENAAK